MVLALGLAVIPKGGELWLLAGRLYAGSSCWRDEAKAVGCASVAAAYTPQNGDSAVDHVRYMTGRTTTGTGTGKASFTDAYDRHEARDKDDEYITRLCRVVNASQPSFGATSAMLQAWQTPELERLCGPLLVACEGISPCLDSEGGLSMLVPAAGSVRTSSLVVQQLHGGDYLHKL